MLRLIEGGKSKVMVNLDGLKRVRIDFWISLVEVIESGLIVYFRKPINQGEFKRYWKARLIYSECGREEIEIHSVITEMDIFAICHFGQINGVEILLSRTFSLRTTPFLWSAGHNQIEIQLPKTTLGGVKRIYFYDGRVVPPSGTFPTLKKGD